MPSKEETESKKSKSDEAKTNDSSADKAVVEKKPASKKPDKPAEDKKTADSQNDETVKDNAFAVPDAPLVEQTDKYNLKLEDGVVQKPALQGMGKMLLLALVALLVAAAGIGLTWLTHDEPVQTDTSQESFSLGAAAVLVEGKVESRMPGGSWAAVAAGDSLTTQAEIRTGADGRVVINIDDGSAIRLDYDSEARLSSLNVDTIVVENLGGQIYSRVVASESGSFVVSVNDTDFVSVGTAYRTLNTADTKGVETYESLVMVKSDSTEVGEGKGYYLQNPDAETKKVVNLDIEKLKKDDFIKWNIEKDGENDSYKDKLGYIGDFEGPALKVNNPPDGKTTDSANIDVQGVTDPGSKLTINGVKVEVKAEGEFDYKLALKVGKNTITVVSKDEVGNKTSKTLKVTRTEKEPDSTNDQDIVLQGEANAGEGGISLSWSVTGLSAPNGYKVVYSKTNTKPVFGEDSSKLVDGKSKFMAINDGKKWYFRVCIYKPDTGSCSFYSNAVSVTAPN